MALHGHFYGLPLDKSDEFTGTGKSAFLTAISSEAAQSRVLTAGASAPDVLVEDVLTMLRRFGPVETSTLSGAEEKIQFKLPPELAAPRPPEIRQD